MKRHHSQKTRKAHGETAHRWAMDAKGDRVGDNRIGFILL